MDFLNPKVQQTLIYIGFNLTVFAFLFTLGIAIPRDIMIQYYNRLDSLRNSRSPRILDPKFKSEGKKIINYFYSVDYFAHYSMILCLCAVVGGVGLLIRIWRALHHIRTSNTFLPLKIFQGINFLYDSTGLGHFLFVVTILFATAIIIISIKTLKDRKEWKGRFFFILATLLLSLLAFALQTHIAKNSDLYWYMRFIIVTTGILFGNMSLVILAGYIYMPVTALKYFLEPEDVSISTQVSSGDNHNEKAN